MTIQLQNKITTQQPLQCRLRPLHSDPIYEYPYPIYQFVFDPKSQNKFDPSHVSPGNYGYFATSFGLESCHRFYLVAPVLKGIYSVYSLEDRRSWSNANISAPFPVVQTTVSQAILGFRWIISPMPSDRTLMIYAGLSTSPDESRGWHGSSLPLSPLQLHSNGSQTCSTEIVGSVSSGLPYRHWIIHALAITINASVFRPQSESW